MQLKQLHSAMLLACITLGIITVAAQCQAAVPELAALSAEEVARIEAVCGMLGLSVLIYASFHTVGVRGGCPCIVWMPCARGLAAWLLAVAT